jgi:hypothetical protein
VIRPLAGEKRAELAERPGFLLHEKSGGGGERAGVHPGELPAEHRAHAPVQDRLEQGTQHQAVAGGHEMDGPAHQRDPDHPPAQDQLGQIIRAEPRQPRPQPVIGRERRLRLQARQVLDRLDHPLGTQASLGQRNPAQQHLPVEQGPVHRPQAQHVG